MALLDAKRGASTFCCPNPNVIEMLQTFEDFHISSSHEKSCHRTMQKFQRNYFGFCSPHSIDIHFCQLGSSLIWFEICQLQ